MSYQIIEKEKEYCIYKHTNIINNKVYIGQTKRDPKYRWGPNGNRYKGCPKFWNAIQKYGWDSFKHEIIEDGLTKEQANEQEKYWIAFYDSMNDGYNSTQGGENWQDWTEEKRKQQSEMVKELWQDEEYRKHRCETTKKVWQDEDYRKKWTEKRNSPEVADKIAKKNKIFWEEHPEAKQAMSEHSKALWNDPNYRKKICKKVICLETQQIFDSVKEAAEWVGVKPNTLSTALRSVTHKSGKHPETGEPLHWRYYEEVEAGKEGGAS